MKELIPEQIIRTAYAPLSEEDNYLLNYKKGNYLFTLICIYVIMTGFCIFFGTGKSSSANLDNKSFRIHFSSSDTEGLRMTIPYICILIFITSTFIAIRFILKSILPIIKDIKSRNKILLFFIPEKTSTTTNNNYLISMPLLHKQQVEISNKDFESIGIKDELCVEILPTSGTVIRLTKKGKEIKYT